MTDQDFPRPRIGVVGDLMLDVSEHGTASRLSPEAPVVVLLNPVATVALGGAANTAANARSLGAEVSITGAVGADEAGAQLIDLVARSHMLPAIARVDGVPTTVKRRYLAGNQQIMRLDIEVSTLPLSAQQAVVDSFGSAPRPDAVVLSDYDKGVVTEHVARSIIEIARAGSTPVVVDSKRLDVRCFAGCTVIAPNHHEATAMTKSADPHRAAELIAEATRSAVLVTLGADGMLILDEHGVERIPSHALDVADVTGAGDTVTAALSVALAEGATVREAARWANHAAAVAVAHAGTYAVPRDSVRRLADEAQQADERR
ncbi:bifunctional heptose 7-phosphate kinase/heptose 1-phosphate adenyltransferase [Oerskovia sp. KBS0722]|uniref:bifunctional heptose 7-phosphate kinase/heptose 1-phosphate adenyltransferase n=1 Tax=Oerskovia sp. KBS0722 TaxID=1179673 RepID=UPI00110DE45F|nr:PfkB family carbohydrate kinase [Oerskovia sp. KBS0722]QDW64153.1 D-glycero-beta-D-manno-heptose-7-phosphate kinase [Oerskovia sp. KBS0722]